MCGSVFDEPFTDQACGMPRLRSQVPSPTLACELQTAKKNAPKNVKDFATQNADLAATAKNYGSLVVNLSTVSGRHAPKSSSQESVAEQKAVGDANFKEFCVRVFGSQAVANERLSLCSATMVQKLRRVCDKVVEINDLHKDFVREAENSQRLESNVLPVTALRSVNFPHLADQLLLSSQVVDSIIDCTPACSSTSSTATMDGNRDDDASAIKTSGGKARLTTSKKLAGVVGKRPPAAGSASLNRKATLDYDSVVLAPDQFDELVAAKLRHLSSMAPLEPTELMYSTTEPNRLSKRARSQWTQNATANDPSLLARVEQILRAKPLATTSTTTDDGAGYRSSSKETGAFASSIKLKPGGFRSKSAADSGPKQKIKAKNSTDKLNSSKNAESHKLIALPSESKKTGNLSRNETPPPSLSRKSIKKIKPGSNMTRRPLGNNFSPRRLRKRPN